jgi:hypothetical protein
VHPIEVGRSQVIVTDAARVEVARAVTGRGANRGLSVEG